MFSEPWSYFAGEGIPYAGDKAYLIILGSMKNSQNFRTKCNVIGMSECMRTLSRSLWMIIFITFVNYGKFKSTLLVKKLMQGLKATANLAIKTYGRNFQRRQFSSSFVCGFYDGRTLRVFQVEVHASVSWYLELRALLFIDSALNHAEDT
jgi:hypothetical protein